MLRYVGTKVNDVFVVIAIWSVFVMAMIKFPVLLDFAIAINIVIACGCYLWGKTNVEQRKLAMLPVLFLIVTMLDFGICTVIANFVIQYGQAEKVIGWLGCIISEFDFAVVIVLSLLAAVCSLAVSTRISANILKLERKYINIKDSSIAFNPKNNDGLNDLKSTVEGMIKYSMSMEILLMLVLTFALCGGIFVGIHNGGEVVQVVKKYVVLCLSAGIIMQIPFVILFVTMDNCTDILCENLYRKS